jgi:hypothetical protein
MNKYFTKKNKILLVITLSILSIILLMNGFFINSPPMAPHYVCYSCFWENQPTEIKSLFNEFLSKYNSRNNYIESERLLILGRLNENEEMVCNSLEYKINFINEINDYESLLVLYEEIYFLSKECDNDISEYYLNKIIEISKILNKSWKIEIYNQIKNNNLNKKIEPIVIEKDIEYIENPTKMIIGNSKIIIDETTIIGSQVDRYNRDWYSFYFYNFPTDVATPDYNLTFSDIDYHEGFLIRKITSKTNNKIIPLPNSNVIKTRLLFNSWYATDEKGIIRFNIFDDKIQYSTNLCYNDVCLFKDTHGISALVPEAIYNNVSLVVSCGDSKSKMDAAYYLSQKNIDVYFPTDRFISEIIGYRGEGTLLGSAPIKHDKNKTIIGNRPIDIKIQEPIIVQDTLHKYYPLQYYDSSARYFREIENVYNVDLNLVFVNVSDIKQTNKIISKAKEINSTIIAIRIQYEEEYEIVKEWLLEDKNNKAILFHSVIYKPGYKLFEEFPKQTSFGDPHPLFE